MLKKLILIGVLSIVISCAFSTRGGNQIKKQLPAVTLVSRQDTIIKYIERPPLSKQEQAVRDTAFRRYIASIIKPYTDDLKNANDQSVTNLTIFLKGQGQRIDSINELRYGETKAYQLASIQRDSFLIQSIIKDHRIDSLQRAVVRIEKSNIEATKITIAINNFIVTVSNTALWVISAFMGVWLTLTLFLEFIKYRRRKKYKLFKQHE